jgi:hypothetical protein
MEEIFNKKRNTGRINLQEGKFDMGMTTGGIIFLVIAWGCVITLTVYCFYRVLKSEKK